MQGVHGGVKDGSSPSSTDNFDRSFDNCTGILLEEYENPARISVLMNSNENLNT